MNTFAKSGTEKLLLVSLFFSLPADNVFAIKSWVKNKFQFEDSVLDKQFDIPSDFDYIE